MQPSSPRFKYQLSCRPSCVIPSKLQTGQVISHVSWVLRNRRELKFCLQFLFVLVLHFFCFLMSDWNNLTGSQRKFKKEVNVKEKLDYQYSVVQNPTKGQAE